MDYGCRIGRVKMKKGGDLVLLPTRDKTDSEWLFGRAMDEARGQDVVAAGFFITTTDGFYTNFIGEAVQILAGSSFLQKRVVELFQ